MAARVLTPQAEDFPRWYQEVVSKAEMADNGPVRGTMVILPYGYSIWERLQSELDRRIKAAGARNAYFPLFIPESYLAKEAEHVEGFSPELAVVTHGGGQLLEEPVVVRPTSEMIINSFFAKWVQSWRDLPLLINQWANVVRWEMRPRVFLRTTEFLWQEGHTAHVSSDDARSYALQILQDVYLEVMRELLAVPVLAGRKTRRERFAGAVNTLTCEGMMRDGKALQMGTSHELGQNFARAFDTTFLDDKGERVHVWQTSWGVSTRLIGGLIMAHGDDRGLRLPPRIAPVQVVVLVVRDDPECMQRARSLVDELEASDVLVELDDRVETSFGRRATAWELKGVPVRIEVGPRDLSEGVVTVVRRDLVGDGAKAAVPLPAVLAEVRSALEKAQSALFAEATAMLERQTARVGTVAEAAEAARTGFAMLPWEAVGEAGEDQLAESGVAVRCIQREDGSVPLSEDEKGLVAVVARAY